MEPLAGLQTSALTIAAGYYCKSMGLLGTSEEGAVYL